MAKELTGKERRELILKTLTDSDLPVSGTELGRISGVSRQVVVQDIALLRTEGHPIVATAKGYVIEAKPSIEGKTRVIKVFHTNEQVAEELNTIVDLGGTVVDVMVNHRTYGKVTAPLNIRNRREVKKFVAEIQSGKSTPLLNVTSGYHFHTIHAESDEVLDEIENELADKGFLAELMPYEMMGNEL